MSKEFSWLTVIDAIKRAFNDQHGDIDNDSSRISIDRDYFNINTYLKSGYVVEIFNELHYNFSGLRVYRIGIADLIKLS